MKKALTFLLLSCILNTANSQIKSRLYYGDYPFFYRLLDSNLNPNNISKSSIKKVDIRGDLWPKFTIHFIKTYNTHGFLIKEKSKTTRFNSKLLAPWYWLTNPLRRKHSQPEISEIDSTLSGQINYIKYGSIQERYIYNQNGKLTTINVEYSGDFSTAPRVKKIKLDYDSENNLTMEKVEWIAGDSSITRHYYLQNLISKSVVTKYYFENIQLSKSEYTWRLAEKPKIETFEYTYLPSGLLDLIKIIDKNQSVARQITFEYK